MELSCGCVCGGGGVLDAGLLESLPSLVAATGRPSGSAIHFYHFASCCIFFSLVFHSLTHAILLFKLLKKKTEAIFPRDPLQGSAGVGGKGKNTFIIGSDSQHLWLAGDTVNTEQKKKENKKLEKVGSLRIAKSRVNSKTPVPSLHSKCVCLNVLLGLWNKMINELKNGCFRIQLKLENVLILERILELTTARRLDSSITYSCFKKKICSQLEMWKIFAIFIMVSKFPHWTYSHFVTLKPKPSMHLTGSLYPRPTQRA